MEKAQIDELDAGIDALASTLIAQAQDISTRQAEALAGFAAEWQELYAKIPEGRLRALAESTAIKASSQTAEDNRRASASEVERFANLAKSNAEPSPALATPVLS